MIEQCVIAAGVRDKEGRATIIAAALFATHPIHTDAVSSIVSRGEMLSASMFMLSFLNYKQAVAQKQSGQF